MPSALIEDRYLGAICQTARVTVQAVRDAYDTFEINESMTAADAQASIDRLAAVVRAAHDAATDEEVSDQLDELLSELENFYLSDDHECVVCDGQGVLDCPGQDGIPCSGDENCKVCLGETTVDCARCEGSGEDADRPIGPETAAELRQTISAAIDQLPLH